MKVQEKPSSPTTKIVHERPSSPSTKIVQENLPSPSTKILQPLILIFMLLSLNRPCKKDRTILKVIIGIIQVFNVTFSIGQCWKVVECIIKFQHDAIFENIGLYIFEIAGLLNVTIYIILGVLYIPNKLLLLMECCDDLQTDPLFEISFKTLKRKVKMFGFATPIVMFTALMFMAFSNPDSGAGCFVSPYPKGSSGYYIHRAIVALYYPLFTGHTLAILGMLTVVCTIIKRHIERCQTEFQKLVQSVTTVASIERIRSRYIQIYGLCQNADNVLTYVISTIITLNSIGLCLLASSLNFGKLSESEKIMYLCIALIAILTLAYITVQCCLFNEKAKSCLETAIYLNSAKMDQQAMAAVNLFIENMKSIEVGLTFMKLFTLDKKAFISIYGTLLTYIIVVLQFKPS